MTIYFMKQSSFLGYGSRYLLSAKQQTLTGNRLLTAFEFGIRTELKARPQMTVSYRKVRRQCYLSKATVYYHLTEVLPIKGKGHKPEVSKIFMLFTLILNQLSVLQKNHCKMFIPQT